MNIPGKGNLSFLNTSLIVVTGTRNNIFFLIIIRKTPLY